MVNDTLFNFLHFRVYIYIVSCLRRIKTKKNNSNIIAVWCGSLLRYVHMYRKILLHRLLLLLLLLNSFLIWIFFLAYYSCFMSLSTIIMASSITFASASFVCFLSLLFLLSPPCSFYLHSSYVFNDYLRWAI